MLSAANPGQALGRVVVDELIRCGMKHACLSPGSRSTPLALALSERPELHLHVLIDERSASFLALGIAKQSHLPVAMLTTSGTAAANIFPAVVEANHSGVPLLALTADRPPELRDTGAGQTIDQIKIYGNSVRWFAEVGVPEPLEGSAIYWRSIASRAYHIAGGPRPGPVHLNFALRDPLTAMPSESGPYPFPMEGRTDGSAWIEELTAGNGLDSRSLEWLSKDVQSTERGLVVVGTIDLDSQPLVAFAEKAGWPLIAEATSNARSPSSISTYDAILRVPAWAEKHRPDLVIRFGSTGTSPALNRFLDPSVKQIVIDPTGSWRDPSRASRWFTRADPVTVSKQLVAELNPKGSIGWLDEWNAAEQVARRAIDKTIDSYEYVTEPAIARDLASCLPEGGNLIVGSSMPVRDLDWFMAPRTGIRILANRGANGIDGFVSTTLGVAVASKAPTVGLCGDLTLLHDQNGFLLSRYESVGAVFVVINNNGGGIFSFLPQAGDKNNFEQLFGTPQDVDFGQLCDFYSMAYSSIETPADLSPKLREGLDKGGLCLLEARTDRDANVAIHAALNKAVEEALG